MAIPSEIQALIDRINQELDETEREATQGLNLLRPTLWLFPDNAILIQFFATLNNVLFFVETYRERIRAIENMLGEADVAAEEIQEVGEELATILGRVVEAKIRVERIINRLEDLQ